MDDYKPEEMTTYPKIDPTISAPSDPYSDPIAEDTTEKGVASDPYSALQAGAPTEKNVNYMSNPYDIQIPPPPPVPNIKKTQNHRRYLFGICIFLIGCIIGATFLFFSRQTISPVTSHQNTTSSAHPNVTSTSTTLNTSNNANILPTPTSSTTVVLPIPNDHYTAMDIVKLMQEKDKNTFIASNDHTIWDWSHDNYFISMHASSSVQWTGCAFASAQQCADTGYFGLWVYADANDAQSAGQQVTSDSLACSDNSPASSGMHVSCGQSEAEFVHGRCLLVGNDGQSIYGQIMLQYCI